MKFETIDNCPVPSKVAPQIRALKADVPGAVLTSCYRGDQAAGLLKRLGKSTQAMLYNGWLRRLPGFNPANPPGQSTHELRSDGVAYAGPRGRILLSQWKVGMDWPDALIPKLIAAAKKRGWTLVQPYHSGSEFHHLNFVKAPKMKRPLQRGVKGSAVKALTKKLYVIHDKKGKRYMAASGGTFGPVVEAAVKKFQRDHHITPVDGVVGPHTMASINASYRYWTKRAADLKKAAKKTTTKK